LILDGHGTGLLPENKNKLNKYRLAPKGKGISMGVTWNDGRNVRGKPFICRKLLASSPEKARTLDR